MYKADSWTGEASGADSWPGEASEVKCAAQTHSYCHHGNRVDSGMLAGLECVEAVRLESVETTGMPATRTDLRGSSITLAISLISPGPSSTAAEPPSKKILRGTFYGIHGMTGFWQGDHGMKRLWRDSHLDCRL